MKLNGQVGQGALNPTGRGDHPISIQPIFLCKKTYNPGQLTKLLISTTVSGLSAFLLSCAPHTIDSALNCPTSALNSSVSRAALSRLNEVTCAREKIRTCPIPILIVAVCNFVMDVVERREPLTPVMLNTKNLPSFNSLSSSDQSKSFRTQPIRLQMRET
jgi:hypothetical protein